MSELLEEYDGLGLADLIKKKKIKEFELMEEAIKRIETLNPEINAVITKCYDLAEQSIEKGLPNGPFKGVPILIKDLSHEMGAVSFSMGCKSLKNYIPHEDSEFIKRLKNAGVVILGKTNVPEFGLMSTTEPEAFGDTHNPWDLSLSSGGSSGGSAAACTSSMVPMASGSDGGGSIRIPASYCGLFGLKVTRGRTPTGPKEGESFLGASVNHMITKSVRDSAAILDLLQGPDIGQPCTIPPPKRGYIKEVNKKPNKLKIAFSVQSPLNTKVHEDCIIAIEKTVNILKSLGHEVYESKPSIDWEEFYLSSLILMFADSAFTLNQFPQIIGREATKNDVETTTWIMSTLGNVYSAMDCINAKFQWDMAARAMGRFHEDFDLFLTPTTATPPPKIGELKLNIIEEFALEMIDRLHLGKLIGSSGIVKKIAKEHISKVPFTQLANATGQPAMSIPIHWNNNNIPIGVQFIGRFGDEATLFRLAAQLEKEKPWFDKQPSFKK